MTSSFVPEYEVRTDKSGRVIDNRGAPLRDRRNRTYGRAPFMGRPGTAKTPKNLAIRIKLWEDDSKGNAARKCPGSNKK